MRNKKFFNSKAAKGLVSLIAIIILLSSILATTFFYESSITANVARETSIIKQPTAITIKEVNDIRELSSLNEGWYYIKNGYVYYLEHFDSYAPLYIKVKNLEQQNGLLLVDENGKAMFDESFSGLAEKEVVDGKGKKEAKLKKQNKITGKVTEATSTEKPLIVQIDDGYFADTFYKYDPKEEKIYKRTTWFNVYKPVESDTPVKLDDFLEFIAKRSQGNNFRLVEGSSVIAERDWIRSGDDKKQTAKDLKGSWDLKIYEPKPQQIQTPTTPQTTDGGVPIVAYDSFSDALAKEDFGKIVKVGGKEYRIEKATITKYGRTEEIKIVSPTENPKIAYGATESQVYIRNDIRFNFEPAPVGYKSTTTTASGPPQQPPFDPSNPEKFKTNMEDFIVATKNYAKAKEEEDKAKPLIAAAERWGKNPTNQKAKEEFYFEAKKWDIYQNTKANPDALIQYLDSSDKTIAKSMIIERINEEEVRKALSSSTNKEALELNKLVQLESKLSPFGAKVDFETGEFIDRTGARGWGIRRDGTIDPNMKGPDIEKQIKEIESNTDELVRQYKEDSGETLTKRDGELLDSLGRELELTLNSQTGKWEVTNRQSPEKIKTEKGLSLTRTEFLLEILIYDHKGIGKESVSVYKDALGKLYDHKGAELKSGNVIEASKFGDINTQIVYEIKQGQIDKEKPVSAKIGTVDTPPETYKQLLKFLEGAGPEPKIEGAFIKDNPLVIIDKDGKVIAQAYSFENFEGIEKGTILESNFRDGKFLSTKTTSSNGKIVITEEKEFIERDTGKKDEKGNAVKENVLRTKSWVKIEEEVKIEKGKEIKRTFTTTRTYELGKDSKQISDSYKDVKIDTLTGEPIDVKVVEKGNRNEAKEKEEKNRLHMQWTSRKFFADVERVLTQFQGLAYYQTLFIDEDAILRWQDDVDRAFATLYLGTEYWSSKICRHYLDGEDIGIAYAETPQGLAQIGAHIEATRTEPILTDKGREFIYKITFNVRNGDFKNDLRAPEEMNINIFLTGERTATVFKQDQKIKRGSQLGRAGRNAIVQESKALYTEVCIKFDDIPLKWKLDNKELCNTIVESSGEAATATAAAAAATAGSQGSGTAGTTGEGDINDF